jgi:hypothetical protein
MRDLVRPFVWYAAVAAVSLGLGGLAVDLDHAATAGRRPELTARGDAVVRSATPDLRASLDGFITTDLDTMSSAAREALSATQSAEPDLLDAALDAGSAAVDRLEASLDDAIAVRSELDRSLDDAIVSDASRQVIGQVDAALRAAGELPIAWQRFEDLAREGEATAGLIEALVGLDRARTAIEEGRAALD